MTRVGYCLLLVTGLLCLGLTIGLVLVANDNQRLQVLIQGQQQALTSGLLGPQGRQIAVGVVQDMTAASAVNPRIRDLLIRYQYPVPEAAPPSVPVTSAGAL